MRADVRAEAIVRTLRSLKGVALRAAYAGHLFATLPAHEVAWVLDRICARAEQGQPTSHEALLAIVHALNMGASGEFVQRLREEAAGEALLALERFVRQPMPAPRAPCPDGTRPSRVIDDGCGRPLTLGERKALARRPDRELLQRLLADPHPDVVGRALDNVRTTEDDVVRLAAKRPNSADVLAAIARHPRWLQRRRVRLALIMNPATAVDLAMRLAALLGRRELRDVAAAPHVGAAVRAVCIEHLRRRIPADCAPRKGSPVH